MDNLAQERAAGCEVYQFNLSDHKPVGVCVGQRVLKCFVRSESFARNQMHSFQHIRFHCFQVLTRDVAVAAVLLGALTIHGFEPGPVFFTTNLDLIYALFAGVIIAQIALLIVGLSLTGVFARLIRIDPRVMIPAILFSGVSGSSLKRCVSRCLPCFWAWSSEPCPNKISDVL
ncbi:MAG: tripartite tricarboxylate transporter permease [Yoonia sp.]|uniref:tripartite tricarboxylate transporter permease n=1 Tax=Yoonia sp. TaxID=2212373 RepID=UPI003EF57C53